jgi:hypothetical protein
LSPKASSTSWLPEWMREFAEYERWFDRFHSRITISADEVELGPYITPTRPPKPPPWQLRWAILFSDATHLFITENWWPCPAPHQSLGYRKHFAFHYGMTGVLRDELGFPDREETGYGTILRIDVDRHCPHIHFKGEDHIQQHRVKGLDIQKTDPFLFVSAVREHKQTGKPLEEILRFEVEPCPAQ